jgi:hypothetical protein
MQPVSGWAGLVAEMHAVKLSSYPLDDAAHAGIRRIHLTPKADLSLPTGSATAIAFFNLATSIPTKASRALSRLGSLLWEHEKRTLGHLPVDAER